MFGSAGTRTGSVRDLVLKGTTGLPVLRKATPSVVLVLTVVFAVLSWDSGVQYEGQMMGGAVFCIAAALGLAFWYRPEVITWMSGFGHYVLPIALVLFVYYYPGMREVGYTLCAGLCGATLLLFIWAVSAHTPSQPRRVRPSWQLTMPSMPTPAVSGPPMEARMVDSKVYDWAADDQDDENASPPIWQGSLPGIPRAMPYGSAVPQE